MAEGIHIWLGVGFMFVFREHTHLPNCGRWDGNGLKHTSYLLEQKKEEKKKKINEIYPKATKFLKDLFCFSAASDSSWLPERK